MFLKLNHKKFVEFYLVFVKLNVEIETKKNLQGRVAHACNSNIQDYEAEGSQVQGQPGLLSDTVCNNNCKLPYGGHWYSVLQSIILLLSFGDIRVNSMSP
jgi:hypothetical protein